MGSLHDWQRLERHALNKQELARPTWESGPSRSSPAPTARASSNLQPGSNLPVPSASCTASLRYSRTSHSRCRCLARFTRSALQSARSRTNCRESVPVLYAQGCMQAWGGKKAKHVAFAPSADAARDGNFNNITHTHTYTHACTHAHALAAYPCPLLMGTSMSLVNQHSRQVCSWRTPKYRRNAHS
eukprot:1156330-Pelagomonas_calceolata.AAC.4